MPSTRQLELELGMTTCCDFDMPLVLASTPARLVHVLSTILILYRLVKVDKLCKQAYAMATVDISHY